MGKKMNTEKVIWTKCSVLFKICKWSRSDGVYKHSNSTETRIQMICSRSEGESLSEEFSTDTLEAGHSNKIKKIDISKSSHRLDWMVQQTRFGPRATS